MVLFLLSANGGYYSAEEMDDAYDRAYYLGILERGQRQEDKPVTRAELIKTILDMAGDGRVAWIDAYLFVQLPGCRHDPGGLLQLRRHCPGNGHGAGQRGRGSRRPMTRRPGSKWPSCSTTL